MRSRPPRRPTSDLALSCAPRTRDTPGGSRRPLFGKSTQLCSCVRQLVISSRYGTPRQRSPPGPSGGLTGRLFAPPSHHNPSPSPAESALARRACRPPAVTTGVGVGPPSLHTATRSLHIKLRVSCTRPPPLPLPSSCAPLPVTLRGARATRCACQGCL